jgi:hypothetical protein
LCPDLGAAFRRGAVLALCTLQPNQTIIFFG